MSTSDSRTIYSSFYKSNLVVCTYVTLWLLTDEVEFYKGVLEFYFSKQHQVRWYNVHVFYVVKINT